ncbi:DUF6518 family protein [Demequina aestuarii]|uniref:DUF6518 family protein n=1 Tax=Demequina aestuarii TaxID=327095 RepID=UPI00128C01A4|nr:DUF6518 family protein [Demequina aestuarii]
MNAADTDVVTPRRRWPVLVGIGWAFAGAMAGVSAKIADEFGSWWADAATYPAVWVVPIAIAVRAARGPGQAALHASAFFIPMTVAYYAWAQLVLGFGYAREVAVWLVLAIVAVPLLAAGVRWARDRSDLLAGAATSLLAALALAGGSVQRVWLWAQGSLPAESARPVQAVLELAVAAAVVWWVPRSARARIWAVIAAVPIAWVVVRMLPELAIGY